MNLTLLSRHYGCKFIDANQNRLNMLNLALNFFILAIIAVILGFGGLAGEFMEIAQFLTVVFVILFTVTAIRSVITGRNPPQL